MATNSNPPAPTVHPAHQPYIGGKHTIASGQASPSAVTGDRDMAAKARGISKGAFSPAKNPLPGMMNAVKGAVKATAHAVSGGE